MKNNQTKPIYQSHYVHIYLKLKRHPEKKMLFEIYISLMMYTDLRIPVAIKLLLSGH